VLAEMAKFFDLGMTGNADGTISHSLSTTVIAQNGEVIRFYPGNDWAWYDIMVDLEGRVPGAA